MEVSNWRDPTVENSRSLARKEKQGLGSDWRGGGVLEVVPVYVFIDKGDLGTLKC